MKRFITLCLIVLVALGVSAAQAEIKIGMLAQRGPETALKEWEPLATYLSEQLGDKVTVVPLTFTDFLDFCDREPSAFIFTNPWFYVRAKVCSRRLRLWFLPKPPVAPTKSVMVAVGARHSLLKRRMVARLNPRKRPSVKLSSAPISSAMLSLPIRCRASFGALLGAKSNVGPTAHQHQRDGKENGEDGERESWGGCAPLRDRQTQRPWDSRRPSGRAAQ